SRATNDNCAHTVNIFIEQVVIKGMQWLADFEHHEIGYVDDIADAANANLLQASLQPGRAWADFYAARNAGDVPRAKFRVLNLDSHQGGSFRGNGFFVGGWDAEWISRERADFPGDSNDAV